MSLYDDAIKLAADITGDENSGFGVPITITDSNNVTVTVIGLTAKHHMAVDDEGRQVSSKTASISVSEQNILAQNPAFLIRNSSNNEVIMKGYKVTVKDSSGVACNYQILHQFPDETLGLITCTLTDYNA